MVETLLSRCTRSFSLCNACDNGCRLELDMPPPGPENTILRTGRLLSTADEERIRQTIAKTDKSLAEIGAKVKELLSLVAQLHKGERESKEMRKMQ